VAAAVAAPVVVAAALIWLVSINDDSGDAKSTLAQDQKAFQTKADDAFKPLAEAVKVFLPKAQDFEAGKIPPEEMQAAVDAALPEFLKARKAVGKLKGYKHNAAINRYFFDTADLYVEVARLYSVAADPAAEPLRAQLNIAARRVRTLGDRIYDRARVVIDPTFYPAPTENVEIRPPTEVPDWAAEGMAAGPPLADPPGPPAADLPTRQETCAADVAPPCRPEQPEKEWVKRVKQAGFPQPRSVARALADADGAKLAALAAEYEAKTRTLMAGPDPQKDRERAARTGLGLLTAGEAARLGQAATLLPTGVARGRLEAVSRRLLVVSDDLLKPGLGFQSSGLKRSLLSSTKV
jgi:hypothetical protein